MQIGVVGCGRVAGLARGIDEAYHEIEVSGLFDISEASIARGKVLHPKAKVHPSYDSLLADEEIDWIMVGSFNAVHCEHTVKAFEAGKHVFCEKPLATTVEDCLAMQDAWIKSGKKFNIGFVLRYSNFYRKIRELIDEGMLGDIISLEANETIDPNHGGAIFGNWRNQTAHAGSNILEKCSHDIDIVNWLVGSRASRVAAFAGLNFFTPKNAHLVEELGKDANGHFLYLNEARNYVGKSKPQNPFTCEKDILDNYAAIIEYENEVRVSFHYNSHSALPERRIHICGSRGSLRGDLRTGEIEWQQVSPDIPWSGNWRENAQRFNAYDDDSANNGHGGGDEILMSELGDCMLHDGQPYVSLEEGLESSFTAFAIDESVRSGHIVDMASYWKQLKKT